MAILVICRTRQSIDQEGRALNTVSAAAKPGRRRPCAGGRPAAGAAAAEARRRRSPASPGCWCRRRRTTPQTARTAPHWSSGLAGGYSHPVRGGDAAGKNVPARGRAAGCGADQRHRRRRDPPTPSCARSTPATRSPPSRAPTRSSDHRAHHRVRRGGEGGRPRHRERRGGGRPAA